MTAHKAFKQLVRARMRKTGECYTAARRHLLREGPRWEAPLAARHHLAGSVPGATALRVLLSHAGLVGPDGAPLSEAMVFGIAGGISIGVFQFFYAKEDFASFFLAGRHLWHDDLAYLRGALADFGVEVTVEESSGAKRAESHLRAALEDGRPCVAWVDAACLPHRASPESLRGSSYHIVTVYSVNEKDGIAWIGDSTDTPVKIGLKELAAARARIQKFKNRVLSIRPPAVERRLDTAELERLVLSGLDRCRFQLATPAMKSSARNFQLVAIEHWADRLDGSTGKDSWETVFQPGPKLWRGLTSIYDSVEHYGTGGGLCRPLMADFLDEASGLPRLQHLAAPAQSYRQLGEAWSALARMALPDAVPALRRARELLDTKAERFHDAAPPEETRAVWDELAALERRFPEKGSFQNDDSTDLRRGLKEQALAIHAAEVDALQQLASSGR